MTGWIVNRSLHFVVEFGVKLWSNFPSQLPVWPTREMGQAFLLVQLPLLTQTGDSQDKMQLTQKFCISALARRCLLTRILQPHLIRTERFRPSHSMIACPGRPRCVRHTSAGSAFSPFRLRFHDSLMRPWRSRSCSRRRSRLHKLVHWLRKTRHSSRCCSSAISKNRTPMWPANWRWPADRSVSLI